MIRTYLWKLNSVTSSSQNCTPRQEFPRRSKGGDHVQIPITFGITTRRLPDTPDFAGIPTYI